MPLTAIAFEATVVGKAIATDSDLTLETQLSTREINTRPTPRP